MVRRRAKSCHRFTTGKCKRTHRLAVVGSRAIGISIGDNIPCFISSRLWSWGLLLGLFLLLSLRVFGFVLLLRFGLLFLAFRVAHEVLSFRLVPLHNALPVNCRNCPLIPVKHPVQYFFRPQPYCQPMTPAPIVDSTVWPALI